MKLSDRPLYTAAQIRAKVSELAATISRDARDNEIVAIVVLKGAIHFGSDLIRALNVPITLDFVQAKSYAGTASGGRVDILARPTQDLRGKHVLIIEDILDTGVTARALIDFVNAAGAATVAFVALFDKPSRRKVPVQADYSGFTIDDLFIVGYGLDYEEQYRELPDVYTFDLNQ